MKKIGPLFLLLIITLILNIIPVQAAIDPSNSQDPLGIGINPDTLPKSPDELKDISTTYLKQEWTKLLADNKVGQVILKISDVLTSLNFFWKPVLGMEYSLSWFFIFGVAVWFVIFYIVSGPLDAIFNKKIFSIIGGFCVASLVGISGAIKQAANLLSLAINNVWIAWISIAIAVIIIIVIITLSGGLKKYLKKQKEEQEKMKTEEAQKIIQTQGKVSKKELESYSEK